MWYCPINTHLVSLEVYFHLLCSNATLTISINGESYSLSGRVLFAAHSSPSANNNVQIIQTLAFIIANELISKLHFIDSCYSIFTQLHRGLYSHCKLSGIILAIHIHLYNTGTGKTLNKAGSVVDHYFIIMVLENFNGRKRIIKSEQLCPMDTTS